MPEPLIHHSNNPNFVRRADDARVTLDMQLIEHVQFDAGHLPAHWLPQTDNHTFEPALRCGRMTRVHIPLPGFGFRRLRVEVTADRGDGLAVDCGNGRANLRTNLKTGHHALDTHGGMTLAEHLHHVDGADGPHHVIFDFDHGQLNIVVDDQCVLTAEYAKAGVMADALVLTFWENCLVREVRIIGDSPLTKPQFPQLPRQDRPLELEVAVDLPDDLSYAPYTAAMFEQLFDHYVQWGVKRVHWFYYGGTKRGLWEHATLDIWDHFQQTVQNIGGEILPHVVNLAHQRGIELFGLWKPFELALMLHSIPHGTNEALERGKIDRIGGSIGWASHVARQRRDLMMQRRPNVYGRSYSAPVTRIDLVKEDDRPAAFLASEVRIFVSDDNRDYRPYDKPFTAEELICDYPVQEHSPTGGRATGTHRRCRVMRLSDLDIRSRFVVLVPPTSAGTFANTLINLLHVSTASGIERRITIGLHQRTAKLAYDIGTALQSRGTADDFLRAGVEFDVLPGTPSACLAGFEPIGERHFLDGSDGMLAFARGKDRDTVGCMSPAFAETRTEWRDWLSDMIAAGVNGVDLRVRNHHSHLTWGEYGFEAPVREAFLARHGQDIWETESFDRAAWRVLRGEFYTTFYREARQLLNKYGRHMRLHVSPTLDVEPDIGGSMNMHFNWRQWIDEGLADSVTMKEVYPGTTFSEEILSHTRPRSIPVYFSPYSNNIWKDGRGLTRLARRIELALAGVHDGFQLYENCALIRPEHNGTLTLVDEQLPGMLRNLFK